MREGELPLPPAFYYLNLMICRSCDLNLVMKSSLASKWQFFKVGMTVFQLFYEIKLETSNFKADEDIKTRFKSQALNTCQHCSLRFFYMPHGAILTNVLFN